MQFQPVSYNAFQDTYSQIYLGRKFSEISQPTWDHAYRIYINHVTDSRSFFFFLVESIIRFPDCQLPSFTRLKQRNLSQISTCILATLTNNSRYYCPQDLLFHTLEISVSDRIRTRLLTISSEYRRAVWNFYEIYVLLPSEAAQLMHAHQNIIDQFDERLTYFKAITIIGNRLEPRLAIFCHFLLYEFNNFNTKSSEATFEGIKFIFFLINLVKEQKFKTFLKLYTIHPFLHTITGRPIEETKKFPSLHYLSQAQSPTGHSGELDFITVDTLLNLLSQV